ncbi:hypothetical protein [Aeribacillus alveayuensis]|uniref:DUF4025 domain-containing protein n=1 Tax=Aeribacillus alveayuensis TaxID=279215 RepID=A0ABT9VMR8_9BACI|nr:hypothetical protein [Bacillus alveayuensis]
MKKREKQEPTIAPGIDDDEELEQNATKEEIARGDYTEVTTLSYDEVAPS